MNLSSPALSSSFSAQVTPVGTEIKGRPSVGAGLLSRSYPAADIIAAMEIAAAAPSDVATLTLSTLLIAQTTGSPVITDGDGNDLFGNDLPTLAKVMGLRLRTGSANTGTVAIAGSNAGLLPAVTLRADSEITLKLPAAGIAHSAATLSATFTAADDELIIEILGKA